MYAPGAEIRQYLHDVAEKFGALRFIKTSHRLDRAVWDAEKKKWYGPSRMSCGVPLLICKQETHRDEGRLWRGVRRGV